jgi:hypothetical protein
MKNMGKGIARTQVRIQRYPATASTSTLREEKQVAKENQPAWQFASIGDERGCHTG